jgi:hypothetical protein
VKAVNPVDRHRKLSNRFRSESSVCRCPRPSSSDQSVSGDSIEETVKSAVSVASIALEADLVRFFGGICVLFGNAFDTALLEGVESVKVKLDVDCGGRKELVEVLTANSLFLVQLTFQLFTEVALLFRLTHHFGS